MNIGTREAFTKLSGHMDYMNGGKDKLKMTAKPENHCNQNLRQCPDGACVSSIDLCMEEEKVNQNTVLVMIIIGVAVIVAMVILYCFQQRSRRLAQANTQGALETIVGDGDNASLNNPPPGYDEVVGSNLYLPTMTSQNQRAGGASLSRLTSTEEPMTPPPNYDTALVILAQSNDSFFPKKTDQLPSSVFRRSVSTDTTITNPSSPRSPTSASTAAHPFDFRRNVSISENS